MRIVFVVLLLAACDDPHVVADGGPEAASVMQVTPLRTVACFHVRASTWPVSVYAQVPTGWIRLDGEYGEDVASAVLMQQDPPDDVIPHMDEPVIATLENVPWRVRHRQDNDYRVRSSVEIGGYALDIDETIAIVASCPE